MDKVISDQLAKLVLLAMPNKKDASTVGYAIQMINAERSNFVNAYMWFLLTKALCYINSRDFGITLTDESYVEVDETLDKLGRLLNGQN
jgi:hypothetical protein